MSFSTIPLPSPLTVSLFNDQTCIRLHLATSQVFCHLTTLTLYDRSQISVLLLPPMSLLQLNLYQRN